MIAPLVLGRELARAADVGPERHDLAQDLGVGVVAKPLAHGAHWNAQLVGHTLGGGPAPAEVKVGA
jgi:hypothetical protein